MRLRIEQLLAYCRRLDDGLRGSAAQAGHSRTVADSKAGSEVARLRLASTPLFDHPSSSIVVSRLRGRVRSWHAQCARCHARNYCKTISKAQRAKSRRQNADLELRTHADAETPVRTSLIAQAEPLAPTGLSVLRAQAAQAAAAGAALEPRRSVVRQRQRGAAGRHARHWRQGDSSLHAYRGGGAGAYTPLERTVSACMTFAEAVDVCGFEGGMVCAYCSTQGQPDARHPPPAASRREPQLVWHVQREARGENPQAVIQIARLLAGAQVVHGCSHEQAAARD
jgi:hypothetical protein